MTTKAVENETMVRCPGCLGSGTWESACCNGAGGCDCRGQIIPMGKCLVCSGTGEISENTSQYQRMANCRSIQGLCFIGAGPTSGPWASKGARGYRTIQ